MGTITLWMQVSLDGYVEGPDGAFDWPVVQDELHAYFNEQLRGAATFLYGRRVYEMMAGFWPSVADSPGTSPRHRDYARIWTPMPKLAFSHTLTHADWNTRIASDPAAEAATLRERDGMHVLFGGAQIAHAFQAEDLLDEYRLFVHPVTIGGGKPLFASTPDRRALTLVESRPFAPGVVHLHYRRERRP
jgi:dihydrofolate reductase